MVAPTATIEALRYISADEIPELAALRAEERTASEQLMIERARQQLNGEYSMQPIDALSTAQRVLTERGRYGEHSPEYREAQTALFHDCHRLVAEWRRKNTYEYFPTVRHQHNPLDGEFYADGRSTLAMTTAGLIPTAYAEENTRRVNEHLEEFTSMQARKFGGLLLDKTVRMRTVSECPEWAMTLYTQDGQSRGGYVPEIEKVKFRDMIIDPETGDRMQEEIAVPGTYIDHYVIQKTLARSGLDVWHLDRTALHGMQLFAHDDLFDFIAQLDEVASEEWCVPIFMGEVLPEGAIKNYEAVRAQAIERQQQLERHSRMVADFVLDLTESNGDTHEAPMYVEEFVKQMLVTMAQANTGITTEMFDARTAQGIDEVYALQMAGRFEDARERMNKVVEEAPGGGYCGAGTCDLVRSKALGSEAASVKKLGFDPKHSLIDKGNRRCKCGKRSVVYDLKQAKKGCMSCGATTKY